MAQADAAGKGGDYVPVSAVLLDTRSGVGGVTGTRGAGSTTAVTALGVGGVPASNVSALMVEITAIGPTASTALTVFPDGATRPVGASLNVSAGQTLSNSAVVQVGTNGKLAVHNSAGSTHVKLDVQGYFTTSTGSTGAGFVPIKHTYIVDTNVGQGTTAGTIASGASRTATLTGSAIPPGASALVANIRVTGATTAGTLTIAPTNEAGTARQVNYLAGSTHEIMTVKLPSDGQVTLTNSGSAVHVVIATYGYFGSSASTGAGMRPLSAVRLANFYNGGGTSIPSGGRASFRIGGAFGLPTLGIAAAAVNVTVAAPTASGSLQVLPGDALYPPDMISRAHAIYFTAGQTARSYFVVADVRSGAFTIHNGSEGTVQILADLQGWFADPLPTVAIEQNTPTSVLQTQPSGTAAGTIEYAYTDNLGRVRVGHQTDPDNYGSVQWTTISGNDAFTGRPGLYQPTGKPMEVVTQNIDSNIWRSAQTATGSASWNPWTSLGGSMPSPPLAAVQADGTSVLFSIEDGRIWHYRSGDSSPTWKILTTTPWYSYSTFDKLTVARIDSGLRMAATTDDGVLHTAVYYPDGTLSDFTDLGGNVTGSTSMIVYPGYRTRVVGRSTDGSVVTKLQNLDGTWPSGWDTVGTLTAVGTPAAILDPVLGRTAIVVRGVDNEVYRVFETAQGSGAWGDWARVNPDVSDPAVTDPTVAPFAGANGQSWMIVFRNANDATRVYERQVVPTGLRTATPAAEFTAHTLPIPPA
ncbi:hypothetical protein [Micromonospora echinospora]|uniref:hypothetical protein n=1 Tax=Micromonospora echinospora TaxID=1877 RepID=UPI000B5AD416|nr:hypothetical protein [Micromonospora echinospora]